VSHFERVKIRPATLFIVVVCAATLAGGWCLGRWLRSPRPLHRGMPAHEVSQPGVKAATQRSELDILTEMLGSDQPAVRGDAQRRLAQMGASAVPRLLEAEVMGRGQPRLREGAINVLRTFSGREYAQALLSCAGMPALKSVAFQWLKHLTTDEEVAPIAEAALDTSRPTFLREELIGLLSELPGEEARKALLRLAQDADPRLRSVAVYRLYCVAGDDVTQCLLAAVNDATPRVAEEAVRALGKRRSSAAIAVLCRLLGGNREGALKMHAAEALGKIGDPGALPALAAIVDTPAPVEPEPRERAALRRAAAHAVKEIHSAQQDRARIQNQRTPGDQPPGTVPLPSRVDVEDQQ